MRLVTFSDNSDATPRIGVEVEAQAILDAGRAFSALRIPERLIDLIAAPGALLNELTDAVAAGEWDPSSCFEARNVRIHAPLRPRKVIGVGLNYVEHVEESSRTLDTDEALPERPVLFSKPGTAIVGPGEPILHNARLTCQLDWECELAVVIGRSAKGVAEVEAMSHVFGYSIINDISARDQRRAGQWFYSKGQDTYAPFGPAIVTQDEIPDPHNLDMRLTVNGEERQRGNSRQMLFRIPQLIADISAGVTLEPGDVIMTGSPQGVGAAMNPPTYLVPGDVVECTIEGIGTLRNPVQAI